MNSNSLIIYDKYTKLLDDLSELFNRKSYNFEEFYTKAEDDGYFPENFHHGKNNICEYLKAGLRKGHLNPLQMATGEDILKILFDNLLEANVDCITLFQTFREDIDKFSIVKNILDCLQEKNGEYVLYLHQFNEPKQKSKVNLKVAMKTSFDKLKQTELKFFTDIWEQFEKTHLLASSNTVLEYIREGKCFEMTWYVNKEVLQRVSQRAPHCHLPFQKQSITRVWVDDECVYSDEVQGRHNLERVSLKCHLNECNACQLKKESILGIT